MQQPKKLLTLVHEAARRRHLSSRTEESYIHWIKRYIFFHGVKHPNEMSEAEVEAFLTHLAVDKKVAASTQNQALSALLFLYRNVRSVRSSCEQARVKKTGSPCFLRAWSYL